jgi:ABC-type uncharacterized transport system ATPase subunit
MNDTILQVEHLMMHFGGIKALNDVNLEVKRGSITALIGPNGAGKTTVFNCLTGFYRATGGAIRLDARSRITDVIQVLGQKLHPTDFFIQPRWDRGCITKCSVGRIWLTGRGWHEPFRISGCFVRCR